MAARPVVDEEGSVDVVCWKAATVETGKTTEWTGEWESGGCKSLRWQEFAGAVSISA
jgi:hypothetical protein